MSAPVTLRCTATTGLRQTCILSKSRFAKTNQVAIFVIQQQRSYQQRSYSDYAVEAQDTKLHNDFACSRKQPATQQKASGLERLPTFSIFRNLLLGSMITNPIIFKMGYTILNTMANSRLAILNPDANPVLRAVVKPLVYDQFCAGTNQKEIFKTRDQIRKMGYAGVILCYGREAIVDSSNKARATGEASTTENAELNMWRDGNLSTLDMAGSGDWLGIKLTGAGPDVMSALLDDKPAPAAFIQAMDAICLKARAQNCRLWIDAEQQAVQKAIDKWTLDLMRKYNTPGRQALVYTTLQAYLKQSRPKLEHQLSLAAKEGWTLAIKLVRGAYIAHDQRTLIHDTKQDTDDSYNGIVRDLLSGTNLGFDGKHDTFPRMQLFLAGHNPESVSRAWNLIQELSEQGRLKVVPDFGQLQGMADELGCKILQRCEELEERKRTEDEKNSAAAKKMNGVVVPRVYRCLTWGSIQECMQYLLRRLVENKGGADRMRDGMAEYYGELKRRMLGRSLR